jgi:hypothetical protein
VRIFFRKKGDFCRVKSPLVGSAIPIPSSSNAHIDFRDYLQQHIRSVTVDAYLCRLERLSRICDLNNPEKVKSIICNYPSSESYKELLAHADA